ncbi:adenine-specific methyltransferase EcoRI family protein [Candidatus Saccharibacteria bacterium]|nr:MAG: adenine-specific methyltransferase EcoRI family protein [Candidatus Saccharibacteria bacterium]
MAQINLQVAKQQKKDEFYTQLVDIEKELRHYKEQFRGKVVLCNCDDPFESNFFKYFASNFNHLGLKKLIATSYSKSPVAGMQLPLPQIIGLQPTGKEPFKIEINEVPDVDGDGAVGITDVEYLLRHNKNTASPLAGNGDFRSDECVELLKQADIVVTNPPFSLFREFLNLLVEHKKDFLIIGNTNALTYKEVFQLFKDDKVRTGYTNFNVGMFFVVPSDWEQYHHIDASGRKIARVSTSCWFTSLDVAKHKDIMNLYKKYSASEYPAYFNYDAIEVSKAADIPMDYDGKMGVPITFLDKHNPAQFEIVGSSITLGKPMSEIAEKGMYQQGGPSFYLKNTDGTYTRLYHRVVIRTRRLS